MKKKHFKTSKGEFAILELPQGAAELHIFNDLGRPYLSYRLKHETGRVYFEDGNWELIGNVEQLTDGDKWDIVEPSSGGEYFKSYEEYGYEYATASESFDSLLKSLDVHFENPISNDDRSRFAEWVEWRKKVWDKENTYLFKKT